MELNRAKIVLLALVILMFFGAAWYFNNRLSPDWNESNAARRMEPPQQ